MHRVNEEHHRRGGSIETLAPLDDVTVVVAHACQQGGRTAEPGAQAAVLLRLVAALARRAFAEAA